MPPRVKVPASAAAEPHRELPSAEVEVAARVTLAAEEDFSDFAHRQGWTDGLPVVEPTAARVEAMMASVGLEALEVLGAVPPGRGVATVETVAANAVMAGCEPRHFPVLVAALRAMLEPCFNLSGQQATTNPVTPAVMVSGPGARELEFNSAAGCFGPGCKANATVGRALRFCLTNVGYALPGETDMATQGSPTKYAFCFAENQAGNPWDPQHVDRGFAEGATCVTCFQASMVINILDYGSHTAESLMMSITDVMTTTNHNNAQLGNGDLLIALCPEHAGILAQEGLSKDDVKQFLAQNALIPASQFSPGVLSCVLDFRGDVYKRITPTTMLPVVEHWSNVQIVCAGGAGSNSAFIPGWGGGQAVCAEVES